MADEPETNQHGQPVGPVVPGWQPRPRPGGVPLAGRYVTGRPLHPDDAPELFDALCGEADDQLWTYRTTPRPPDVDGLRQVLAPFLAEPAGATYVFAPTGGRLGGMATLFPVVPLHGVLEISSVLWGRAMQRTPAATEAAHLLLDHVFGLGYRRVEWKCDSLNEPSRRAAQRLGFAYEGRFRRHMVTQGRSRDTDWFSLLDDEWPVVRDRHQRWLDPATFDADGRQRIRLADA